jgi:hypothetical protein
MDMDWRTLPEALLEAIDLRSREILKTRSMTWKQAYQLAEDELLPPYKKRLAELTKNKTSDYYRQRLRKLATEQATHTSLPYEAALRTILKNDPKLAQAVTDEWDEEKEPAQVTLIAIGKFYERSGMSPAEAYTKAILERPDLRERWERMRRQR